MIRVSHSGQAWGAPSPHSYDFFLNPLLPSKPMPPHGAAPPKNEAPPSENKIPH